MNAGAGAGAGMSGGMNPNNPLEICKPVNEQPDPPAWIKQVVPESLRYKTKLCAFYEQHKTCANGDRCMFAHGEEERGTEIDWSGKCYKTKLCLAFGTQGKCFRGAECLFAHGEHELRPLQNGNINANSK